MKLLKTQKRLAGKILKAGETRISFDNTKLKEIGEAITREDVKNLIEKGYITVKPKTGVSRGRAIKNATQRKKGRQKGAGMKRGQKKARTPKKRAWINRIRPQRILLHSLKEHEKINNEQYRKLYGLSKAGFFRSVRHLKLHVSKMIGEKLNE